MTEDIDSQLGRLLRASPVPQRDALFRIRILERGERERYRRQTFVQWAVVVLLVALPLVLWWVGRGSVAQASMPELMGEGLFGAFAVALLAAAALSVRGILQAVRWLRRGRSL